MYVGMVAFDRGWLFDSVHDQQNSIIEERRNKIKQSTHAGFVPLQLVITVIVDAFCCKLGLSRIITKHAIENTLCFYLVFMHVRPLHLFQGNLFV